MRHDTQEQTHSQAILAVSRNVIILLSFCGILFVAFAEERTRAEVAGLRQAMVEALQTPRPGPAEADIKAVKDALARLTARVEAIKVPDESKAVDRLTVEVKNLANRVEALAGAKAGTAGKAGQTKPAGSPPSSPVPSQEPPRPFFGPGYPAYPGY